MTLSSSKLWGGRFSADPDAAFAAFNRSFDFDRRLFTADVRASIAHAKGLKGAGVLSEEELTQILGGLQKLGERAEDEEFFASSDAEDVHTFIEAELVSLIGDTGKKLHTGRSRNDQVATAFRLWLRETTDELIGLTRALQRALVSAAERHRSAAMPGYTHLQRAQPVLWAHWCLAYFEMHERDIERLKETRRRINISPLGSAALAGTSFDIDREAVARELGFAAVTANSLDAVSDRDFAVDLVGASALLMVHLSRMAEDLILYCSSEFGFVTLGDSVSTGSSLMPQKKNPDALELIRGKAGRVIGHHVALLTTLKGLPLAYNKDMQEDKEAVFDTAATVSGSLRVAAIVLDDLKINEERAAHAARTGYLNATELADHLVRSGVPFRTAHDAVGKLVLFAIDEHKELDELSLEQFRTVLPDIDERVFDVLSLESTLRSKSAVGGTSRERVDQALNAARETLEQIDG